MAEVTGSEGRWTFDGDLLRIVPGNGRGVHRLRRILGELEVPLEALAGIAFEPGRKSGVLRVRLRQGADPLVQAAGNALDDSSDPYRLNLTKDASSLAEYFVDEVRDALQIEQVGTGPVDRWLLAGPGVPLRASGGEGSVTFDGETVRLDWSWMAEHAKQKAGPKQFTLAEIAKVELHPSVGLDEGHLRFHIKDGPVPPKPKHDPYCLTLWGTKKEGAAAIAVAAAVVARLPHPSAPPPADVPALPEAAAAAEPEPQASGDDHDVLLRRLRELGDLHKEGILTEEEFATAKQALLRRF
ncbi:Tat pathway signal sequence domain protein [Actinomadura sp. CNU-125]|uniref:DUF4429 domain-containing protein n=1 Tax=Actinomadura sp. CNU-125 TaxID=1904961 RepID=UPI000959692F|nr:DUF4429 domain-containing protein [Actinomadura sp. CNU-125]OLT38162.1 Tat pathway signal sequence domain protein [Actinomadura sp. CNU-125]